jgi:hypothetical protein
MKPNSAAARVPSRGRGRKYPYCIPGERPPGRFVKPTSGTVHYELSAFLKKTSRGAAVVVQPNMGT